MSPTAISQETSLQIKVCRVLCIFFMMYVHVKPQLDTCADSMDGTLTLISFILVDLFGRASVPALSVISGFLVVSSLLKSGLAKLAQERLLTLIVPMAFWNLTVIALTLAAVLALGQKSQLMDELSGQGLTQLLIFKVLAINNAGAIVPLNFLRDVFVCALLSPVLLWGSRRFGWAALVAVWLGGLFVGFAPVVYRPHVLMFFSLGVFIAERGWRLDPPPWLLILLASLFVGFEWARHLDLLSSAPTFWEPWHQVVRRAALSGLFISISLRLARAPLADRLVRIEPAIYFIFLAHEFFFRIFWGVWSRAFGSDLGFPYHLFFIANPIIWMLLGVQLNRLIDGAPRWAQMVVRGKHRRQPKKLVAPRPEPQPLG